MQRTAAGIGQERAARLEALERASPEWRPWVELLRATFQADADLAPAPEPLTPDARPRTSADIAPLRSEEHTSELQSRLHLVCRLLLEKKKKKNNTNNDTHAGHLD